MFVFWFFAFDYTNIDRYAVELLLLLVTFLDFMTPVVRGQRQADVVCFDFSNRFDLVPSACSCIS
jgi:hypothetical protein